MRNYYIRKIKTKGKKSIKHEYKDKNGKSVSKKTLKPYLNTYIAPAYDNVKINKNLNAKVLAIGYDEKDRPQYIYNKRCESQRGRSKFKKLIKFGKNYNKLLSKIEKDYSSHRDTKEKQIAMILKIIMDCNFRIGNDKYTKDNNSFGVSTLESRHINIKNGVNIDFIGKKGVQNKCEIENQKMKKNLKTKKKKYKKNQRIFTYQKDRETYEIKSTDVNEYLGEYTTKNFRTWSANVLLIQNLLKNKDKDKVTKSIEFVADKLHHTPSICKKNYIDPKLVEYYEKDPDKFCKFFKGDIDKKFTEFLEKNY